jgi:ABC-type transport system involved in multi-copper enzyme maturation permease subunit
MSYWPALLGAVSPKISNWLTPLWLVGVGALVGVALLGILWLLAWVLSRLPFLGDIDVRAKDPRGGGVARALRPLLVLFSRRSVAEIPAAIREGVLWPLFVITVCVAVFGIVGGLFVRDPVTLLSALKRLPQVGTRTVVREVAVSEPEDPSDEFSELVAHQVPIDFRFDEVRRLVFRSDQDLLVASRPFLEVEPGASLEVHADEQTTWRKGEQTVSPFIADDVDRLYIRNLGGRPAEVTITVVTAPPHPEVVTVPITALAVAVVFLLYLLQRAAAPRLSAIALATYKSEIAQPLFGIIVTLGTFLLLLFIWIPYYTLGEDIKMLKDSGLTLIMVLGIVQAIWAASTSVSEEIEGRTALTVLSKPIGRRSFIVGKFLGIVWTLTLLFVWLGLVLLIVVAYKPIYDARESSTQDITWQLCHMEMVYTVPGLALAFMETVVLAAVSVAISTRLPLLANFVICFSIYLLGHLTPLIVQSSVGQVVFVQFFGQLIATVFPVLDHFNIQAAVAAGAAVPIVYLFWSLVYCLIYSIIAMLLALVLFEDRDLA